MKSKHAYIKQIAFTVLISMFICTPVSAEGVGETANDLMGYFLGEIQQIVLPLATVSFVSSFVYFFFLGKREEGLERAKRIMLFSLVGLAVVALGPKLVSSVWEFLQTIK